MRRADLDRRSVADLLCRRLHVGPLLSDSSSDLRRRQLAEWLAQQDTMTYAGYDGILPITDDDISTMTVTIFVDWVKTVYGAATLEENLTFIAYALGGKGSPARSSGSTS